MLIRSAIPHVGVPPPPGDSAVARHRDAILDLCIGGNKGVKAQQRYLVLRQVLQGDLRLETVDVYFFRDYSTKESLDAAVRSWAHRLSFNLFPKKHKVFCRSRWQTSSVTVSEITLLGAVHNLLHRAVPVWLTLMGHKSGAPLCGIIHEQLQLTDAEVAQDKRSAEFWKQVNVQNQGSTEVFAKRDYFASDLIVLILSCRPGNRLLTRFLALNSKEWENGKVARLMRDGSRSYRILEYHDGTLTQQFWEDYSELLFVGSIWEAVHPAARTVERNSFAFAMSIKGAGLMIMNLDAPSKRFPFKWFRAIRKGCNVSEMIKELLLEVCQHDVYFSPDFIAFCEEALVSSGMTVAILLVLAWLWLSDISRIECRHAAVRRWLRKSQTHFSDIGSVSADWAMMRSAILAERTKDTNASGKADAATFAADVPQHHPQAQGQGRSHAGAYRAFLSERFGGIGCQVTPDMLVEAAKDYRAIKDEGGEEFEKLLVRGQLGVVQGRTGLPAFGKRERSLPENRATDMGAMDVDELPDALSAVGAATQDIVLPEGCLTPSQLARALASVSRDHREALDKDKKISADYIAACSDGDRHCSQARSRLLSRHCLSCLMLHIRQV